MCQGVDERHVRVLVELGDFVIISFELLPIGRPHEVVHVVLRDLNLVRKRRLRLIKDYIWHGARATRHDGGDERDDEEEKYWE